MTKRILLAVLVLGLAACAGESTEPNTTVPVGDGPELTIEGRAFGAAPELAPGETMTIVNLDGVRHTFTSRDDEWPAVPIPGESQAQFTAPDDLAPGQYVFFCEVHPDMGGSITIGS